MTLADVSRDAVLAAIAEFDALTRHAFLAAYGFGEARRYFLVHNERMYDSKAIMGSAHGYATGQPLRPSDFSGGEQTVARRLSALGFEVRDQRSPTMSTQLISFGEIEGIREGAVFSNRQEVSGRGVHRALQAGIVGNGRDGAESIVVSGGYEDDEDHGSWMIYTGHGGRDESGQQIADQTFDSHGNAALVTSQLNGTPVRVVRGANSKSGYAPTSGYRYDGLFRVERWWRARGRRGYYVCRYQLVKIENLATESIDAPLNDGNPYETGHPEDDGTPDRRWTVTQRVVRSTEVANAVKRLHDHTCQACGVRINVSGRGYSEGAHIRPLGAPHNGPDIRTNILCLCANCHVLFDNGALVIADDLTIRLNAEPIGTLRTHPDHVIGSEHLAYHRSIHA